MSKADRQITEILNRLEALEAEKKVRLCMNQYMALCDDLSVGFDLSRVMALFTEDAVWQGAGKRYAKTFGVYKGKPAIQDMFARYTKTPGHFELNAHFLCNEVIDVDISAQSAVGSWMLIQPSTFTADSVGAGKSQLSCARINAEFSLANEACLMTSFTTQNSFSRPMSEPWDNPLPLAVPKDK